MELSFCESGRAEAGISQRKDIMQEKTKNERDQGFTLIELLVAMTIGLVVIAAVSMAFRSQQKSYILQEQVAAMQQNLRAAIFCMEREIRMAGYDPTFSTGARIITANSNDLQFTMDLNGNGDVIMGDPNEQIRFSLTANRELGREEWGGGLIPIAENIDAVDFVYLRADGTQLDDDGAGNVDVNIPNIRAVEITLVARTGRGDRGFQNNTVYTNQQGTPIFSVDTDGVDNDGDGVTDEPGEVDNFRRRVLSTRINCRNLGI
jgi:type IV pilus assembly protein PilW